jgi:hypothetical protein
MTFSPSTSTGIAVLPVISSLTLVVTKPCPGPDCALGNVGDLLGRQKYVPLLGYLISGIASTLAEHLLIGGVDGDGAVALLLEVAVYLVAVLLGLLESLTTAMVLASLGMISVWLATILG